MLSDALTVVVRPVVSQIKSFLLDDEAVKTTINDQVGWREYTEGSLGCELLTWVDVS